MMILGYPVIGEFKIRENVSLPLVDIPMMSDEEWKRLSAAQAIKKIYTRKWQGTRGRRRSFSVAV